MCQRHHPSFVLQVYFWGQGAEDVGLFVYNTESKKKARTFAEFGPFTGGRPLRVMGFIHSNIRVAYAACGDTVRLSIGDEGWEVV